MDYCIEHSIELVIPLFDIDLPILAKNKNIFNKHNIRVLVGDSSLMEIVNDKWATQEFLNDHGFLTKPSFLKIDDFEKAYQNKEVDFPVFVKPRYGMGSIGLYKANNFQDLDFYYELVVDIVSNSYLKNQSNDSDQVIIQAAFPGQEYGLDVINDLNGKHRATIVKKKLAMRSGETDVAITVKEPKLESLGKKLGEITQHPANMDVDVFFDGTDAYILEMNARFGGGYPFSHLAGVDLPAAIVKWHKEEDIPQDFFKAKIGIKGIKGIGLFKGDL